MDSALAPLAENSADHPQRKHRTVTKSRSSLNENCMGNVFFRVVQDDIHQDMAAIRRDVGKTKGLYPSGLTSNAERASWREGQFLWTKCGPRNPECLNPPEMGNGREATSIWRADIGPLSSIDV